MSTDISLQSTTYQVGNRQWLLEEPDYKPNVTLDISLFVASATNEVQTVTIGGGTSGGTFPLTYSGQTASGIAWNALPAAVQTALEGLSNIGAGNVAVGGSAGAYTVTFKGALAGTNVAQMTTSAASLTGGTPTAVVATSAGGVVPHYPNGFLPSGTAIGQVTSTKLFGPYDDSAGDGRQTLYGFTYGEIRALRPNGTTASKVGTGAVVSGAVSVGKLPFQAGPGSVDANGKADTPTIRYEA